MRCTRSRRLRVAGLVFALLALVACGSRGPVRAARPELERASVQEPPERTFDVERYALDLRLLPDDRRIEGTCRIPLDFPPGRGVQYQSMGFAILGEIIARASGRSCAEYLRDEIFHPLGMHDTALGAPEEWFTGPHPNVERIPEIRVPADMQGEDTWNWNSRYWRMLGSPWGGLLTTPSDLGLFAQMMLGGGQRNGWGRNSRPFQLSRRHVGARAQRCA